MQETDLSSGLAMATEGAHTDDAAVEALQAELAKWQARVPKLAGALRERTSEVAALKAELESRSASAATDPSNGSSGIQARDALIEELEARVQALSGKYQDAEGQLHARDLEISQLRQEAGQWREKWQNVTTSLDSQADGFEQKDREIRKLQGELDELLSLQETHSSRIKEQDLELTGLRERSQSLESRNQNLFETTELANRQIETLGENLEHLRAELKAKKQEIATRDAAAGDVNRDIENLKTQLASRDQDIEYLHRTVEEKQAQLSAANEQIAQLEPLQAANEAALEIQSQHQRLIEERDQEIAGLNERLAVFDEQAVATAAENKQLSQQLETLSAELNDVREQVASTETDVQSRDEALEKSRQEVRRLEECVAAAEEATGRFEAERRQLSEQMDALRKRNEHLEEQLTERSDLVVGLEQEKSAIHDKTSSLETENRRLSEALEKSQQAAAGNADHIAQVDARMERQKQLMENLEEEFAQVQEDYAAAVKAHQREITEKAAEIAALSERADEETVGALQTQLNELENLLESARTDLSAAESRATEEAEKAAALDAQLQQNVAGVDAQRSQLAEKVEQLEQQLHKQMKTAAAAEEEAAQARAALEEQKAVVSRVPDEVSGENALLQAEVIKLEGMVRERTEQLNKLRWQQDMLEKQGNSEGSDGKMLVVLNQQLVSAREDNQRLREKVRELEARPKPALAADDLARIRGIGPKLVKQLKKLGITQYDQIATLSEADLDDVDHPLHGMKGRIIKDNWIEQAAKLGGAA